MKECSVKCRKASGEVAAARRHSPAGGGEKTALAGERTKARSAIVLKVFSTKVGSRLLVESAKPLVCPPQVGDGVSRKTR